MAVLQTCQPWAQRSSTLQPMPLGFALLLPETRLHAGCIDSGVVMPAIDHPPEQPAIFGCADISEKYSRVPSEQPMSFIGPPPCPLLLDATVPAPPCPLLLDATVVLAPPCP